MKRLLRGILLLAILSISISPQSNVFALGRDIYMNGETLTVEGEDTIHPSTESIVYDNAASGGKVLKIKGNGVSAMSEFKKNPSLMTDFYVNTSSRYNILVRYKSFSDAVVFYDAKGNGKYSSDTFPASSSFVWKRLATEVYPAGRIELRISSSRDIYIDKIIITSELGYWPATKDSAGNSNYVSDFFDVETVLVTPVIGEHPRLYFNSDDIPRLKDKLHSDVFADFYEYMQEQNRRIVDFKLPQGNSDYTDYQGYCNVLIARAFMYVMGEVDRSHALNTIQNMKEFMATVTFDNSDATYKSRYVGETLTAAACVYDWCYDLLTHSDKQYMIRRMKEIASMSETGYPPVNIGFVVSHSLESLIFNDQLAPAIAIYDEDKDWYNSVSSVVFDKLLPTKNFLNSSGNDHSGSTYAESRNLGSVRAQLMTDALGNESSILSDNYPDVFEKYLYTRLPNGLWFKDGDDYEWDTYVPDTYSLLYDELFMYIGSRYDNPYLLRQGMIEMEFVTPSSNIPSVFNFIVADTSGVQKDVTELPMTLFTKYPMSSMTARTSWQNGINSPTAMAYLNMREITMGDHQHADVGGFQIWYKGMLALDSGYYQYGEHHWNYGVRSVAHNVMLVDDPNEEPYVTYAGTFTPDGGQKSSVNFASRFADMSNVEAAIESGECISAKNTVSYAGPDNYKPEFSYMSSDIDSAYTNKVESYKRSAVFINLNDETFPAAFIVYDNIKSADASFRKRWLLHSEDEPVIDGQITTIVRTDNGQNGKLVNNSLLPANGEITVIGGEGKEYWSNGQNYPVNTPAGAQTDSGKWRIELSPISNSQEDVFLNAMYVTDANTMQTLPMYMDEAEVYYGVTVMDKTVTFPKTRENIFSTFSISVRDNGYDTNDCLITGVATGKWNINGNGVSITLESTSGENCISVSLAPGIYTVMPVESDSAVTPTEMPISEKEDFGDFLIQRNGNLMYLPKPTVYDDADYVAVDGIFTQFGAEIISSSSDTVTFTVSNNTVVLYSGNNRCLINGAEVDLTHSIKNINGEIYAHIADFAKLFGFKKVEYNPYARFLYIEE